MIRTVLLSIAITASILATPLSSSAAENKTVVLDVPGMTCKFCPITIRKALQKVPGVIEARADFDTKTATVTFSPEKTSVEELIKATANAGYPASLKQSP